MSESPERRLSTSTHWTEEPAGPDPGAPDADRNVTPTRHSEPTLTDSGNAERLIHLHGHHLRYVPRWGRWLVCGPDGFWTIDHKDVHVRELAKDVGRQLKWAANVQKNEREATRLFSFAFRSMNARAITAMVDLARGIQGIPLDHEELDADPYLLGCANGVVDLKTGELRPAEPADLMTRQCPVEYDPDAEAPRWQQALQEWFPDPEVRAYLHRLAGSALVALQRDHVFVIHYGHGGNGKGTFTRALQHVLGPYVMEVHLSLLVQTKYREHDTVKADLFRARLAIAVETDRRVRLAEASVKNLSGGDRIRARRMKEDPWSFDPSHSLWLQTNHLPEIQGRDGGIWRRMRVVKWERSFTAKHQDQDLDETLAEEAPGILRWLVEGCLAWREHGLDEPEKVIRDTMAYRQKEDVFGRFQADTGLVFQRGLEIQAQELQDMLTAWASEEGIDAPRQKIGEWLRENGCRQKQKWVKNELGKRKQRRFWQGIGLADEAHQTEQTHAL